MTFLFPWLAAPVVVGLAICSLIWPLREPMLLSVAVLILGLIHVVDSYDEGH